MADDVQTQMPDPQTMKGAISYLSMHGRAGEAADFYARAFGARDTGRFPDEQDPGKLMHCQVEINGGTLMMTDCVAPGAPVERPQGFNLMLVVTDGDTWWKRAIDAGCTVIMPFEKMFWGDRWGMFEDPFGIKWAIDEPAAG